MGSILSGRVDDITFLVTSINHIAGEVNIILTGRRPNYQSMFRGTKADVSLQCGSNSCQDVTASLPTFLQGPGTGWARRSVTYADHDEPDPPFNSTRSEQYTLQDLLYFFIFIYSFFFFQKRDVLIG